ncbi:MAG: hypothetical protein ACE5R6_00875 [Candidatus Heimdallarchaeota archaeon]
MPAQEDPNKQIQKDPPRKIPTSATKRRPPPKVIVDFIFSEGLFFISIKNIGTQPAYKVSIRFDPEIKGVSGTKNISKLPLFRNIEFLAPQKEITTFLDTAALYFAREEPTKIAIDVAYQDFQHRQYTATIKHDLEIYRSLGYITRRPFPEEQGRLPSFPAISTDRVIESLKGSPVPQEKTTTRIIKETRPSRDSKAFVVTQYVTEERIDSE